MKNGKLRSFLAFIIALVLLIPESVPAFAQNSAPSASDINSWASGGSYDCPTGFVSRAPINWMSFLKDDAKLTETVIPGSHDSGTYNLTTDSVFSSTAISYSQTQQYNFLAQAIAGIRYFDIRVASIGGKLVVYHGDVMGYKIYSKDSLESIMANQIAPFINKYPSEFFILHFQSVKGYEEDTAKLIEKYLSPDKYAVKSDSSFPANTTFGKLRANGSRYAVIFNGTTPRDWIMSESGNLNTPYNESVYQGATKDIIPYLNSQMSANDRSKLFVSQAISTPAVRTPSQIESQDGSILNNFVYSLSSGSKANIIIRDFVNRCPGVIKKIISLNGDKGLTKDAQAFNKMLAICNASGSMASSGSSSATGQIAGFDGIQTLLKSDKVSKSYKTFSYVDYTFSYSNPDYMITRVEIKDNWKDGTNGSYTIGSGGLGSSSINVYIKSKYMRGISWSFNIYGFKPSVSDLICS